MNNIDELLKLVPEKLEWKNTTSKKFKKDVYEFFNKPEFKELSCVEIGCARGHTTLILSNLFKKVYAINYDCTKEASKFCNDNGSFNIDFFNQDVYSKGLPDVEADVIMIDAVHTYNAVKIDITNSLKLKSKGKKHLIFDDTGIEPSLLKLVNEYCDKKILSIVKEIGRVPGDAFHRPIYSSEGVICVEL